MYGEWHNFISLMIYTRARLIHGCRAAGSLVRCGSVAGCRCWGSGASEESRAKRARSRAAPKTFCERIQSQAKCAVELHRARAPGFLHATLCLLTAFTIALKKYTIFQIQFYVFYTLCLQYGIDLRVYNFTHTETCVCTYLHCCLQNQK